MLIKSLKLCLILFLGFSGEAFGKRGKVTSRKLDEENWRDVLNGEWMIQFYAPWCPACKDLSKAWSAFGQWGRDLDVNIADVDVTKNPGLSGRFLVTALPTIYHVKDGVFRLYNGPRDKEDFISFIEDKKWSTVEPVPSWKHPDSGQMAVMASFFKLSMTVRDAHNYLVESKSLPPAASYGIFAGVTLLLGCMLGFLIVCMIDCVFPSTVVKGSDKSTTSGKKKDKSEKSSHEANGEVHANGKVETKENKKKK